MTGTLNQVGGTVRTTSNTAEDNGIRLGHYPMARSFYNMMGGTLVVGANYDLCCATDGQGWFNMTGGEVFAKRVMLNERDNAGGYGRLTVSGGTLNVGSLTGSTVALSNGICADATAPYLVELGGAGGTIRAVTNLWIPVAATLFGTNDSAVTFDTQAWTVTLTNKLSGAGGLNKAGAGTLVLSGFNTYTGATRILKGRLVPASANALPASGLVLFGVTADDDGGVLHATGDFSLSGLNVGVANPEALDRSKHYTIITCDGELSGLVASRSLPEPWYLYYDWLNDKVELRAEIGTLILMR
jgi:autotransporter-associated beta strand protein